MASATRSSTNDVPTPKPALTEPAALVLEAVPGESSGTWSIVARSPKLGLDVELTSVSESTLCGVGKFKDAILLTCSATETYWIAVRNRVLRLGEKRHPIPSGSHIELPSGVQYPPVLPCPADTPRVEVPVKLVDRPPKSPKTPDEPYELLLRAGQLEIPLGPFPTYPMGCGSDRVFPKSTELRVGCTHIEAGFSIHALVEDRGLWIERFRTGYHKPEPEYRFGRRLPCGSEVRFSRVHVVQRGWKPSFQSPCQIACSARNERCEDRCYARHADDEGTPRPEFFPCTNACAEASGTCEATCRATGR